MTRTDNLRQLALKFASAAKELGVIILRELFLPEKSKVIPATKDVGGIAGKSTSSQYLTLTQI